MATEGYSGPLTDKQISGLAAVLPDNVMERLALLYLGFDSETLRRLSNEYTGDTFRCEVFRYWAKSNSTHVQVKVRFSIKDFVTLG